MAQTEMALRVRGLRKAYGGSTAVDGIDLDVWHGEVFALLGPNGAGKTTTVEICEGYRGRDGTAFLGLSLPHTPLRWFTFIWIFLLATGCLSLLGVAVSGIAGSSQSAAVVFQFPCARSPSSACPAAPPRVTKALEAGLL
jgi:energy-coupling factor transporter ATP-binding protein EcfA2